MTEDVFVRRASGLVRQAGLASSMALNVGFTGGTFSLWYAYMISSALLAFPAGDFGLASIISLIGLPFVALMYAFLSITLPRSGGDYVYISRSIRPELGFALNFTAAVMWAYWAAWGCYWAVGPGLANLFGIVGYLSGNAGMTAASTWLMEPNVMFVIALALLLIFGALIAVGLKTFLRFNLSLIVLGVIGMVVALAVNAMTPPQLFAERFNQFMLQFGGDPNYFGTLAKNAAELGWQAPSTLGFSWSQTLLIAPILASGLLAIEGTTYIGGEVKRVERTQLLSMGIGYTFVTIANAIVYWSMMSTTTRDFYSAANYVWTYGTLPFPFWPVLNLWTMLASNNAIIAFIIGLGFLTMGISYVPINLLLITRMTFAWSFDRVFPAKLSEVDRRTGSPLWSILFWMIISGIFLVILAFTTLFPSFSAFPGIVLMNFFCAVSAVVIATRLPDAYAASPISRYRVGGVPLITILGLGGVVWLGFIAFKVWTDSAYGGNSPSSLMITGICLLGALIIYLVSSRIHRRRGIDITTAFKTVPPD